MGDLDYPMPGGFAFWFEFIQGFDKYVRILFFNILSMIESASSSLSRFGGA